MADSGSSLTPEKRLLNLIESGGKPGGAEPQPSRPAQAPSSARPAVAGVGGPLPVAVGSQSFFDTLTTKVLAATAAMKSRFGLKTANQIARLALVLFILGVVANSAYEHYVAGKNPLEGLDVPAQQLSAVNLDVDGESAAEVKIAESRNVFLPFAKREEVQQVYEKSSGSGRLLEMTKTLKLTGISFNPDDEKATYCMIEDLAKNITVFLRIGDQISGMRVSQIREESVELAYDNEKIEIR